ncbi:hypothetical protein ACFP3T_05840 [Lactiplantibacillus dongliensis]|uniref:Replication-associated protein ORF2/G2P domain-containing protein n=1 Tax=Lactiplantibacillus dongliensis TaxID=2559919 RepID=A0ABW1R3U2_9LACO|nr:hypothetical protein [Lactiplantibacillus dongliensis]
MAISKSALGSNQYQQIPDKLLVKVTRMHHLTEIQANEHHNNRATVRRLPNHRYLVVSTQEIKTSRHHANRSQNPNDLMQTFKRLRYLINNNFDGSKDERFLTLTYANDVTDPRQISHDFDCFMKRLRRRWTHLDYLKITEPQGRMHDGRPVWHYHVLLKGVGYIANSTLAQLWGHGYVKITKMTTIDNLGWYLTAHLTDIPLQQGKQLTDYQGSRPIATKIVDGQKKAFIKGARLQYYPTHMHLYSASKGIKAPKAQFMPYEQAKAHAGKLVYAHNTTIETPTFKNHIRTEVYNAKR